ncbi:potassium channel protein [Candidatus Poribacteria bacterium]|nr:potassium channel protein [Candidatus Poribacteria bacterium]
MLSGLLVIGTIGYLTIEKNWTLLQAIWMTVITVTGVGYDDGDVSNAGKVFSTFLIIGGFGMYIYCITIATTFLVEGELASFFKHRRMMNAVEKLSNHYIVCGLGDTGVHVLDEMLKFEASFVGIELDEERLDYLAETREFLYIHGDATDDDVLIRSGVERAKGLVACLSRDQDNLFVVISAKNLNPTLRIASKAVEHNSPDKLITAGADEVVLPDHIGGIRLASGILEPHLIDFITKMQEIRQTTRFAESIVQPESKLDGVTLRDSQIQEETGLVVIALRSKDGTYIYNPAGDWRIEAGDGLFIIAEPRQLHALDKLTGDPH